MIKKFIRRTCEDIEIRKMKSVSLNILSCYLWLNCKVFLNNAEYGRYKNGLLISDTELVSNKNFSKFEESMTYILKKTVNSIENQINMDKQKDLSNTQIKQNVNSVFEKSFNNLKKNISNNSELSTKVLILGLFELTSLHGIRNDGYSELASAQMAINHINNRKILPYTLEIVWNDTRVRYL